MKSIRQRRKEAGRKSLLRRFVYLYRLTVVNEDEQRRWIGESEFVLLSNKSTEENTFFLKVDAYQKDGKWDDLKKYIEEQAAKGERSTPKNIYDYTKDVNVVERVPQ